MSGSLGEWSIEDLLQIARITHKTTCIEVKGPTSSGAIFLRDGAVVDAVVHGMVVAGGSRFSQVIEAIERLSAIEDGAFEFVARPMPEIADHPIEVPAVTAAMEKDAIREKRLTDLGVDPLDGLVIGRHIDGALSVKPAVWQLLADLVEPFSLESLQRRMGRRKAVATLLTLDALGVLEPHDGPVAGPESAQQEAVPDSESPPDPALPVDPFSSVDGADVEPDATESAQADTDPWSEESSETSVPASENLEPIVEIFGLDDTLDTGTDTMHEVVTPSETTLVSDVLGDMRSRFREQEYVYQDEED